MPHAHPNVTGQHVNSKTGSSAIPQGQVQPNRQSRPDHGTHTFGNLFPHLLDLVNLAICKTRSSYANRVQGFGRLQKLSSNSRQWRVGSPVGRLESCEIDPCEHTPRLNLLLAV